MMTRNTHAGHVKLPSDHDIKPIISLRHRLHRHAELSGREQKTAEIIYNFLSPFRPDDIITGIGGNGLAAVYEGKKEGPRILIRADLDALPVTEPDTLEYASAVTGVSHKCGHDGHMAIAAGLAPILHSRRPQKGAAILLFQPAEETGEGAARVVSDPAFKKLNADQAFALHNLPGFSLGTVVVRDGIFASASQGLIITLKGSCSHAAEPENGISPALAVSQLIQQLSAMPQTSVPLHQGAKVTVIHASVGERAFGTSPGHGTVMATLRAHRKSVMDRLTQECIHAAKAIGALHSCSVKTEWTEVFPETFSYAECNNLLRQAANRAGLPVHEAEHPFAWSEDFGHFTRLMPGALFGLGSGINQPALHNPAYDFPDTLISTGITLFHTLLSMLL